MAVTAAQVAAAAEVSKATVSRVFAEPSSVAAETREHVMTVARRLGYSPNRIAQSLAKGRTGCLGLIVPDVVSPFFAEIVKAIQARARRRGYAILVGDTDEHAGDEYELAEVMLKQVDGVILAAPRMPEQRLLDLHRQLPIVLVNRAAADIAAVVGSTAEAMRQTLEHLHALGHQRVVYVTRQLWFDADRHAVMADVSRRLGLEILEITDPIEPKFEAGIAATDRVLASGATAVIAQNDLVALGVMSRLAQRGVSVPADISVVGFDDTFMAAMTWPALTSVRMPLQEMGAAAVDVMHGLLTQSADTPTLAALAASLIVRASTGPCPLEGQQ